MRTYEKISVLIALGCFLLIVLGIHFTGLSTLFIFSLFNLIISFLVSVIKSSLTNEPLKRKLLSIGLKLALVLAILSFILGYKNTYGTLISRIFVIPIILSLLFLIYQIIKKKNTYSKFFIITIFSITTITTFLNFGSIENNFFRTVLKVLYSNSETTSANLYMWDNVLLSRELIEKNECKYALEFTKKANLNFEKWGKGIYDLSDNDSLPKDFLERNNGMYKLELDNYECYADKLFNDKEYNKAILFYSKALSSLNNYSPDSWFIDKAMLNTDIARTYSKLDSSSLAVQYFNKAITLFDKSKDSTNLNKAFMHQYIGEHLNKTNYQEDAIEYFDSAYNLFRNHKDSLEYRNDLNKIITKKTQALLYLNQESTAIEFINKATKDHFISESNTEVYCSFYYYNSVANFRLNKFIKAKKLLNELDICLDNINKKDDNLFRVVLLLYKSRLSRQLSDFRVSDKSITKAMNLLDNKFPDNLYTKFNLLIERAELYYDLGELKNAKNSFFNAENLSNQIVNFDESDLAEVYINISKIELELDNINSSKEYFKKTKKITSEYFDMNSSNSIHLLNDFAHINYSLGNYRAAKNIYNKTEELNTNSNELINSVINNGKALLNLHDANFKKADSLFNISIEKSKSIYINGSQNTSKVLMNMSESLISQKKYNRAKESLNESKQILDKIFNRKHLDYGKYYRLNGDIYFKTKNKLEALVNYKKALSIYKNNYPDTHSAIQYLTKKIN